MAEFPIINKTLEDLEKDIQDWKPSDTNRKGVLLDPLKLFYRKAEKGLRKPSRINFETLRRMSKSCSIARLCINTLKHEVGKTRWAICSVDPKTVPDKDRVKEIERFFNFPNSDDNFRQLILKVIEDILVLDAGAIEIVNNPKGTIAEMYYIDGATIKPAIDIHGVLGDPAYYQYMPLNNTGSPDAEFSREELAYVMTNPQGDIKNFGYGLSPLEGVIMVATNILNADNYNGSFFEIGTLPPLLINLGKTMPQSEVENFRAYWKAEIEGKPWKTAFYGGGEAPEILKLQDQTNKDMQFLQYQLWLARLMTAAYEISPQDIGITFDINKATAEVQREISKAKGYKTLLEIIKETFTQQIIWKGFGYTDLMFEWKDVDLVDSEQRARIFEMENRAGAKSINEYRKEIGLDPIKGGVQPFIVTAQGIIQIDATPLEEMEQEEVNDEMKEEKSLEKQVDYGGSAIVPHGTGGQRVESAVIPKKPKKITKEALTDDKIKEVGNKIGVNWNEFSFDEFKMGMEEEVEHADVTGGDPIETGKIAFAHLKEDGQYYSKLKETFGKTVQTGKYLCWMDDRGFSQPFAWTDLLGDEGYYIKPPVSVNLNGPDQEVEITHKLLDKGLNVIVAEKVPYKKLISDYLPSEKLKQEFEEYRKMAPAYYSKKWEQKFGKTRDFTFYIVSQFKKGYSLSDERLHEDMKRDPESYRQAIHDLANLYLVEKEMDLGDRRSNQYIVTPDKRGWGLDYQFEGGESHTWGHFKDEIPDNLDKIPELKDLFEKLVEDKVQKNQEDIKKKAKILANEKLHDFYHNKVKTIEKDLTTHINNKFKSLYSKVIIPKMKEVANGKAITKEWIDDIDDEFEDEDESWQIEETKKKVKLYNDVFEEGLDLGVFLIANKMMQPELTTEIMGYLEEKKPAMISAWEKTFNERSAATVKSSAMTLHESVRNYLEDAREKGLDYNTMSKDIKDMLGWEDEWRAERIARTESVWAANQGVIKATEEMGIDEYSIIYGNTPCEICQDTFGDGGGPFTKEDIGELPLHPNCECTAEPIIPDDYDIGEYIGEEKSIKKDWITLPDGRHILVGEEGEKMTVTKNAIKLFHRNVATQIGQYNKKGEKIVSGLNLDKAKTLSEAVSIVQSALPKEMASHSGIKMSINNWQKQAQMYMDIKLKK